MSSAHTESTFHSLSSKLRMETLLVVSESPEEDEENPMKNPFTVLPDIDIFSLRDKERKKAKAERERMKTMKIHEKMTYSTKIKAKQKGLRKALQEEEEEEARKQATNEERLKTYQESLLREAGIKKDHPLKKETFQEYVNGLREIFRLEYAMAVQQDKMQTLENIVKNEERNLEKAKHSLEKDAAMFDEFLKENLKISVQALESAEKETAEERKITREIQAINSKIEYFESDITRLRNTLKEYKTYRDFLYELSPKEWQEEHRKKHTKKKGLKTESKAKEESPSPPTTAEQGRGLTARTDTASPGTVESPAVRKPSSLEDAESETCSDEDEEPELYFTDPQQLLSVFTKMEEEIVSSFQNSPGISRILDEVNTTHESMEKKAAELKQQVAALKSSTAEKEERVADLKACIFHARQYGDEQNKMLASLEKKVLEVYRECTGENETNLSTEQMLMVIEIHVYDMLDTLETIPPAKMKQVMKAKEKERRIRLREEKLRQQKQQQEERAQRALERSQAPIIKSGRRLMFHSCPPARKEKKKHSQEQMDEEKEEELYYFT
ncbi:PREDICTED: coiled-coil domain-containing protein 37-like [Apaloderma vittatum]|uniref:coiled-coil domain-containing protein 37-like n=1 Tax=Apaloderma vittatum TaxID=57397 RepID=UPI0005214141|nr:PREDICTED: coiled-coil domain-containing protein 37-like [Apaloderma vittatum]